jgi:hypothetical protein
MMMFSCEGGESDARISNPQGKGGSMARFALGTNHLYVVDDYAIKVYEISSNGALVFKKRVDAGFGIETIFVRGSDLFLGANDAMYTYDISAPDSPTFVSRYSHIFGCDPVVVNGNFAYVTLRVGNVCRSAGTDALEIIDISDPASPTLMQSYNVNTPYGLGIDGTTLFLCEGDNGMRVFNVSNPTEIAEIKHYTGIHAYDVIPNGGVLVMTGDDGIFQYDYTNLSDIKLVSHIGVQ